MKKEKSMKFERHSRMLALRDFNEADLESIMQANITVVGAGGLGSPALTLLTSIGFGKIRIIDRDIVDLSNLQRQTIYHFDDIGKPKVDVAVSNLSKLNPDVEFEPIDATIRFDNAVELLKGTDIILDGLDSMEARRAVNFASVQLSIPYIYAGALEYYGNISTFIPGKTGCLHCLVGNMEDNPDATCINVGVSPSILSTISAIEVQEAILLATGKEPRLAGKLMHIDIETLSFDSFEIRKMEKCPICGTKKPPVVEKTQETSVTVLCSESYSISPPEVRNLDLDMIEKRYNDRYQVTRTKRSLILEKDGVTITIMPRGNAVIKGVKTSEIALSLYHDIVSL
ncbi:MAG: ThiF family adenylyltransferase [Candidatus Thorarchaeota archaeon]